MAFLARNSNVMLNWGKLRSVYTQHFSALVRYSLYCHQNGSVTHSVYDSHHHHWHNPNNNSSNHGHGLKNMCKPTLTCAEPDKTNAFDAALRGYVYNM